MRDAGCGIAYLELRIPYRASDLLGSEKLGLGPTAVALKQQGPWTYGMLANHIWSVAGDDDCADVNAIFLSYTTKKATTFTLNTEAPTTGRAEERSVPLSFQVSQLLKVGRQPISLGAGVRYWADSPDNGPKDFGFRIIVTFLFPK